MIAIGGALIAATTLGGGGAKKLSVSDTAKFGRSPASAALVAKVTSVPKSVIDAVGGGTASLAPAVTGARAQTGKPDLLFIGAEYCPYCAAERWAIVNALSRFGTFSKLSITHSSATDALPNTATFSFYGSRYSSLSLTFAAVEIATNEPAGSSPGKALESPTADQQAIWSRFDPGNHVPFLYLAGRYAVSGVTFDAATLQGKTHDEIAAALSDPNSAIAKGVVGDANGITAEVCSLTHDLPATACSDPAIKAIEAKLAK